MLLSTSELFLVGLFKGTLSVAPLDQPDLSDWLEQISPLAIERIFSYADACGLERSRVIKSLDGDECDLDLSSLHWGRNYKVLSAAGVSCGQISLSKAITDTRAELIEEEPSGDVSTRFDELLNEREPIMYGYSPSTPDVLYGMRKTGKIVETHRVIPMPPGLLRVVLRLLYSHIETPVRELMALTTLNEIQPDWHFQWVPSGGSMHHWLNKLDRQSAVAVLDRELLGPANSEASCRLGQHIGQAEQVLREITDWINLDWKRLDDAARVSRCLYFEPADSDRSLSDSPHDDESDDAQNEWVQEIREVARSARDQVVQLGGVEEPELRGDLLPPLQQLLHHLESAKAIATSLGLQPCLPTFSQFIAATSALLYETTRPDTISAGAWIEQQLKRRQALLKFENLLGIVSLIFGELRLRDLQCDTLPEGVGAAALNGWAQLVSNARDAVRVAMDMFRNGVEPYVVINAVNPTLETITKQLAERHLPDFRGFGLNNMLYAILQHAKTKEDRQLEWQAAVGLALIHLRNNSSHDAGRPYDKHDAAFFLNGLTIMMRDL